MSNFSGTQIRNKRESLGLSAGDLATMLDISKANLYKWEKGHVPSNPKDYMKVEKWLSGKIESVPNATTRPQTAQNGAKSGAVLSDTRTEIDKLVARIKAETGLIDEEIAERVGISRQWLSRLCNHEPYSEANYLKIYEAFKDELKDKLTTSTKIPGFEMKPTIGTPTVQDVTIEKLADLANKQQQLVAEMSGKLITLVSKVIDKL